MVVGIDAKKLAEMIRLFSRETVGACTRTSACIGTIDGKQIKLVVEADSEEFTRELPKWKCVVLEAEGQGK